MDHLFFTKEIFNNLDKGNFTDLLNFRYYKRWKKFIDPSKSSVSERLPWINFSAIDYLKKNLRPEFKVFEYGGGGSTLFFLDHVKEVTTVEHNKDWFAILKTQIKQVDKNRWDGNLIEAEPNAMMADFDESNPDHYYSGDDNYSGMNFKSYVSYIDRFADSYFDLVLIDGRSRPSCIKHSVNKVRSGGLIVLDNAERKYYLSHSLSYLKVFKMIQNKFAPLPFTRGFTQTNIWQKL
jgi:hypothetical protein